jgi:putative transposase
VVVIILQLCRGSDSCLPLIRSRLCWRTAVTLGYVWNLAVEQQQYCGTRVAQKRGLNRAISYSGWGLLAARLQHKAFGRVEQVPAAYTSQRCSACGHVAPENRKGQAVFECQACSAGRCNADVNAARNIAAGRVVTARGDLATRRSANREPQLAAPAA